MQRFAIVNFLINSFSNPHLLGYHTKGSNAIILVRKDITRNILAIEDKAIEDRYAELNF